MEGGGEALGITPCSIYHRWHVFFSWKVEDNEEIIQMLREEPAFVIGYVIISLSQHRHEKGSIIGTIQRIEGTCSVAVLLNYLTKLQLEHKL